MPGVIIGKNSIVGAHSFVNHNIPDNSIAFGVPASDKKKKMKYPISQTIYNSKRKTACYGVLNSGNLSLGPKYKEFEEKFAQKIGAKYACGFQVARLDSTWL